jgi:glucokinase
MRFDKDKRVVMTLDAGGTNFVFTAMQAEKQITEPVVHKVHQLSLEKILRMTIDGFSQVSAKLNCKPVAISFAFPGPADYEHGIIGDLQNLPGFTGGVALGPMLEEKFGIPVFINNDGDLFAYGEAISGLLPAINQQLEEAGNPKRYRNLLGVTLGTGFGGGIVSRGALFMGDNSAQGEINRIRNRVFKNFDVEESVSIRGLKREYCNYAGINFVSCPEPRELFEVGMGTIKGNRQAAINAFEAFGVALGDALANAITLVDGLIVIGGGLSGAHQLFLPKTVEEMNHPFGTVAGDPLPRLEVETFNLEDAEQLDQFLRITAVEVPVPFSTKTTVYDPVKKVGIGIARNETSMAVSIGAYAFALNMLDTWNRSEF